MLPLIATLLISNSIRIDCLEVLMRLKMQNAFTNVIFFSSNIETAKCIH